jgi:hypothetical protein
MRRFFERLVLGTMMSILAFVVERRLVKILRRKR